MRSITKILAPLDFSPHATLAVQYAADLARACGATLELVHVLDLGIDSLPDGTPAPGLQQLEDRADDVEARLEQAKRHALDAGAPQVQTRVLRGKLEVEILRAALEDSPDLIVMGTHQREELSHLSIDSVAQRLVHYAPCPVLTLKASREPCASARAMTPNTVVAATDSAENAVATGPLLDGSCFGHEPEDCHGPEPRSHTHPARP